MIILDIILHLIFALIFLGAKPEIFIGSVFPDAMYFVAFIRTGGSIEDTKKSQIFAWGKRLHSLIIYIPLMIPALIFSLTCMANFLYALYLHLILDIFTHKTHGPKFLWPITDKYMPRGLVDWEEIDKSALLYVIAFILFIIRMKIL